MEVQCGLSSSGSYDLDKQSTNNGIQTEEWSYKNITATEWTTGKLTTIANGQEYLVRLRVKDYQDTWSDYELKYVTRKDNILPVADFHIVNTNVGVWKNEELQILDNSYDPTGKTIKSRQWTIKKDGEQIYSGTDYIKQYLQYGEGEYEISLKVTNSSNVASEVYSKKFTVYEDPKIYWYSEPNGKVLRVTTTERIKKIKFTNKSSGQEFDIDVGLKSDFAKDYSSELGQNVIVEVTAEDGSVYVKELEVTN